jgi:restriction system protein
MALWLIRAGSYGEHEPKFFEDGRVYLTQQELSDSDLSTAKEYQDIKSIVQSHYPNEKPRRVGNWSGQIWAFALGMQKGDWVAVPSKTSSTIAIGEILGDYGFDAKAPGLYRHYRKIKWLNTAIPRSAFDQDILFSFGAFMTICEIKRNDAEKRVRAMANKGWKASGPIATETTQPEPTDETATDLDNLVDLEQLSRDLIAKLIIQKFKGHAMARLVESILQAQGLTTHRSPAGPDKGVDILASGGSFGFDHPRICVQVKSGDTPVDRPEFQQLLGAMGDVKADHGLFISWGDFKPTVYKEVPGKFFSVRLWNQKDLIEQLLANYDKLDQDIKAELPLKQIWTVASSDD